MLRNKIFIAINLSYKYYFIILFCCCAQLCYGQNFEISTNYGSNIARFIGNGSNANTALLPNVTLNNPYTSIAQTSNIFGIQLAAYNKKKLGLQLGATNNTLIMYNYINKIFDAEGYYKITSGHVQTDVRQTALYANGIKKIKLYKSLSLQVGLGLHYYLNYNANIKGLTYVDFNGLQQDTLYINNLKSNLLINNISNTFSASANLGLRYKSIMLQGSVIQGFQNLYSGAYKASRNDNKDYNIFLNQINFTLGYSFILPNLRLNKKNKKPEEVNPSLDKPL